MDRENWLSDRFEENRPRLRGVAYRLLGSMSDAEDAVQESWLRLRRADTATVDNLAGWLTTVVARVCLDTLRSRKARREESMADPDAAPGVARAASIDPESEAVLADSVGVALLIVLDRLSPAERLAFVLHDLFATPFDEVGRIMGRSPAAAKQLASRARRRVRGSPPPADASRTRQRAAVEVFLRASRAGDLAGLLAILDPDAVLRIDGAARIASGSPDAVDEVRELKGASTWATQLIARSRSPRFAQDPRFVQLALIDGTVGVIVAPRGRLSRVLMFTFAGDKVTRIEVIGDPVRLRELDITVL